MKIDIAVSGKFHAFRLAQVIRNAGYLDKIFTTYPRYKLEKYGLINHAIKFPYLEAISQLGRLNKIFSSLLDTIDYNYFKMFFFDRLTKIYLIRRGFGDNCIFYGWNGHCLESLKLAKEMGAITVVDRACPHIDEQLKLLSEEAKILGIENFPRLSRVHTRMIREYDVADYIIVPSRYSLRSFLDRGFDEEKVKVVPLISEKPISLKDEHFYKRDQFIVLFVGGNVYRKGLYYLLKAWRELDLENAKLLIRSNVPSEFNNLINGNSVEVLPKLQLHDLNHLYHEASVFCLPSVDEGFGMVVLEAMSSGTPVIVSENVGAGDLVRQNVDGFIVPIRSVRALKEKISLLYDDRAFANQMGKSAHTRATEFTYDHYEKSIVETLKSMVGRSNGQK